jgi:hypothetical protein
LDSAPARASKYLAAKILVNDSAAISTPRNWRENVLGGTDWLGLAKYLEPNQIGIDGCGRAIILVRRTLA